VGKGSSRGPRPPRHPRAPPPIRATSITSSQCRRAQPMFGPLAQSKLEGEGAAEAPPASQAAYALHTPHPVQPPRTHYHHRQIQLPCAAWRRREGGAAEVNQPPRLPLALRCLPRHCRLADRSHLAVAAVRREEEEEENGEAGAAEASGLPGRPSALHHSTPPSTRSRRARHKTTTAGARRGKGEGGATEVAGPPRLPSRRYHCHPAQPLHRHR
jgi:hypothetical protein